MPFDFGPPSDRHGIRRAIFKTLIYADLFDYPVSSEEIVRYISLPARPETIHRVLYAGAEEGIFEQSNGYFTLPERAELIPLRERREDVAKNKWSVARRYGRWICRMPFVRMVAVTGTLAVNNVQENDDVDMFIVTAAGRLWLCRAFVILVVRLAARAGEELCPNYFRSERKLVLDTRNFFTARELAQMVPLYGSEVYQRMLALNAWIKDYLPHVVGAPNGVSIMKLQPRERAVKRAIERVLSGRLGTVLETWESGRKIKRFRERAEAEDAHIAFTSDCCQGHFDRHDEIIMRLFSERLTQYGLSGEDDRRSHDRIREVQRKEGRYG